MSPLSIAYVATAVICLVVALLHLVVASRVPERRVRLLFAWAALSGSDRNSAHVNQKKIGPEG
jgi:hypothetical protein